MNSKKIVSIALILALVLAGAMLIARENNLALETPSRANAMVNVLSPAGAIEGKGAEAQYEGESISYVAELGGTAILRDMPVGEYWPGMDQYQMWLDGEIDLDFEGIPPALRPFLAEQANNLAASAPGPQSSLGGPTLLGGFDSLDSNECCGGTTVVPPDPEMAAGPNHLIAVVNLALEVYDKNGTSLVGPVTYSTFFSSLGSSCVAGGGGLGPFDPNVLYDEEHNRFFVAADGNNGVAYCVGVTQTGDPTGAWNFYVFENVDVGGAFFDYPHAGVGDDAIYVGANLFGSGQGWVYAIDKEPMYNGNATTIVQRQLNTGHETPQPMNAHGWLQGTWPTGGPHYIFAGTAFSNARSYELYTWDDPFGANVLTRVSTFDLQAIHGVAVGSPINSVQQGGTGITGNDPRPLDFEYRNGSGWTAMTVSCNPGSGTRNCIQWAEVDLANQAIAQTDVYRTPDHYRYFPDFAVDHCGNALVGYTRSNSTSFPGTFAAGPMMAGITPSETMIKDGEVTYSAFANRWGDYTGMTIDPDGTTFWYLGEYSKNNGNGSANWGDWIGHLTFDCATFDFSISATPPVVDACIPDDAVYNIEIGSFGGFTDLVSLSTQGVPAGYTPTFSVNPVNPPGSSTLTLNGSGGATAGSYNVDIIGMAPTSTHTTTVQLNLFEAAATISLSSPANGASNVPLAPTFTWTGTGTSYTIDIATDSGFSNIVETATVNDTDYTSNGLAGGVTYYWRVTADNLCGSNVSPTWSFTTVDLQCSSPNLSIPDNDPTGATDEFMIAPGGTIDDLNVSIDVTHTWVGDVVFELEHVDTGTSVVFYDRPGVPASTFGCSGDDIDATMDDEAGTLLENECGAGVPSIQGSFIPNNPLSAFDGEDVGGTWRIIASDLAGGDTGTLNTWCVDAVTTGGGEPDIMVDPASLSSTQPPDTVTMDTLDISNVGTADLTWDIEEAEPAPAAAPAIAPDRDGNPERQGVPTQSDPKLAGGIFGHEGGDVVQDGGFEAGTPNPFWDEFSSNFGTPLCTIAACGQGGGTGPHSGSWWAWFGGITGVSETGSVDQDVTIPVGAATLEFWLEIPVAETTGFMDVRIDGDLIATYTEADQGAFSSYQLESFDVSAYADGGVHNLEFDSTTDAGAGVLNFFIDDVSLVVEEPQAGCDLPTDVPWLSVSPTAGTTISGTTTTVDVTFDSTGLSVGTYNAILCVNSNDPDTPLVEVPVDLTVEEGEPTPTPTSIPPTDTPMPPTDTPMPPTETPPATGVELSTFDGGNGSNWLLLLIPLTVLVVLAAYFKQLRREE